MSFFAELKRRNVFRVAVAYTVVAWLLAQVADVAFDNFGAPDWVSKSVLFVLILGFPLAVFFAWAFELTPEGVKREKDVDRSQSITSTTGRKLDRLIIVVLVAAVGFLLVDKFVLQPAPDETLIAEAPGEIEKSVAVLPFVAMSSGPDDEYFADGITEEILNSLAQLPDLLVTARTSAFAFKGMDVPIPEIAAQLGVANVVEGSVRRSGDRLRVTAQLIRAEDGFHLWSETYDRSAADSFGVQDEIAEKVAGALDVVLDEERLERMRSVGLRNPEAFVAYQKGLHLHDVAHAMALDEMSQGLLEANKWFKIVMELEPGATQAHANHADYYIHFVLDRIDREGVTEQDVLEALEAAKAGLRKAAETAVGGSQYLNAATEHALVAGEWARMAELMDEALESEECVRPSWWAAPLTLTGSLDKTVSLWRRFNECDPLDFYSFSNLTVALVLSERFDEAIDTAMRGVDTVSHRQISDQLVGALIAAGRYEDAENANQRHVDDQSARLLNEFGIAAAQGDEAEARRLFDRIVDDLGGGILYPGYAAVLGDREHANTLAARLDARPLGFMMLADAAVNCRCGAPFDLEVTPNFARMVEEADLAWPPPSPVDWPLKTW
jgi:TolB-like protein/tetratricopeptide (TPR) repeat protein